MEAALSGKGGAFSDPKKPGVRTSGPLQVENKPVLRLHLQGKRWGRRSRAEVFSPGFMLVGLRLQPRLTRGCFVHFSPIF
jgi:hypothetical protein